MIVDKILSCLDNVQQKNNGAWKASCPVHDDENPSLSIKIDNGKVLLFCHANCQYDDIRQEIENRIGEKLNNNVTESTKKQTQKSKQVGEYLYTDENNELLFKKIRYEPKKFLIRAASGKWGMNGCEPVLYNLVSISQSKEFDIIYIVEGEKDVDRLSSEGIIATTNFDGAGKWLDAYNEHFKNRNVYILPDNDNPGKDHAENIAKQLYGVAHCVKICMLSGLGKSQDVSNWLDFGNTIAELKTFCNKTKAWRQPKYKMGDFVDVIINGQCLNKEASEIIKIYNSHNGERGYLVNVDGAELPFQESNLEPTSYKAISKIWEIRTLEDAYKQRPPVVYVVDGMFALPSLSIVYGAPGTLKSMLIADMCASVVCGENWLPKISQNGNVAGIGTVKSSVLWIDLDNGARRTDERFDALGSIRKMPINSPLYYVSMPAPPLDATKLQTLEILKNYIKQLDSNVVVIDNLGLITGDTDENTAGMSQIMGEFRRMCEETNSAIILIHHQRKSYGNNSRVGDALRGHSSIEAAIDLALLIMRESGDIPRIIVKSTKDRSVPVTQFGAEFTYKHVEGTKDLKIARFFNHEILSEREIIQREIINILGNGKSINKTKLSSLVKELVPDAGINKIRTLIEEMAETGKIIEEIGIKNAKIYRSRTIYDISI